MNHTDQTSKPTVLVVEDDVILAEIFAYAFQLSGFNVVTSRDGKGAREQISKIKPAAVMLDLHLPNMSGEDIMSFIQSEYTSRNIITIVATGDSRRASFLQNRVDYVYLKPISFSQIKQIASQIYSELQSRQKNSSDTSQTHLSNSDTGPISPLPNAS